MSMSPIFYRDLAERVITAFVTTWITAFLAAQATDLSTAKAAAYSALLAAGPAVLSTIKGYLAEKYAPGTVSPASLAKS